jgi:hypothetical protein
MMGLNSIGSDSTQVGSPEARSSDTEQSCGLDVIDNVGAFPDKDIDNRASTLHFHESITCPLETNIEGEKASLSGAKPIRETDRHAYGEIEYKSCEADLTKRIMGALVHDFSNSLQAIISVLNLLQSRINQNKPKDFDRLVDVALKSANKARHQVRRLVDAANPSLYAAKPIAANAMIESIELLFASVVGDSIQSGLT